MAMGMVHQEVRVVVLQHNNSTGIIISSITAIPSLSSSSGRGLIFDLHLLFYWQQQQPQGGNQ
ncbi:unnamed protein product [Brugia timori]|uniref:Uncharacterized protein n=1 Tax=Brugia timori TaxID=42155 RepID=A0A0R3Q3S7_9BILA|nr:unnamed protein product [Brugia timori]